MPSPDKPCRHEYVRIFQRKYKDFGRRIVSTRGYLPTGFSNKDFSFLAPGAFCFCTNCRKRLFPNRVEKSKIIPVDLINKIPIQALDLPIDFLDNNWVEEPSAATENSSQEIEVDELQIEQPDVSDIIDKVIAVSPEEDNNLAEGEE